MEDNCCSECQKNYIFEGEVEILDEEMNGYQSIAKSLLEKLKLDRDIIACQKILNRCAVMNDTKSLDVKTFRNEFFKYFLKVLSWTVEHQPYEIYDKWLKTNEVKAKSESACKESVFWSEDKRSYIAAKTISNYGILVYLAVANQPELGWQENGFTTYEF